MTTPPRTTRPRQPFTLRARLRVAFVAAAVLIALGGSAAVISLLALDSDADTLTDRLSPARIAATAIAAADVDQQSAVRGYVLTGRADFLEPYRAGRQSEIDNTALVRDLLAEDPQVGAALDALGVAMATWRADYADPAIVEVATATAESEVDSTDEEAAEAGGKALFDEVRVRLRALDETIAVERAAARDNLGATIGRLGVLVGMAIAAMVAAAIALWMALNRTVALPLDRLAAETRLVAAGDIRRQVVVDGPAEIRALSADVNEMRARIVALLEESEARGEELRAQSEELRAQGNELRTQSEELRLQTQELGLQAEELANRELDLLRSNDELEQFAYVASHDLQEPLRKVASFCQMLQRRYSGQIDEQADQYIAFAVDGAKRMQVLINDLLTFSRVGRTSEGMTEVDTGELAALAADTFAQSRAEAGAVIDLDPLPLVRGDDSLLTQLFYNLVGNALKFRSPDRAVQIRLSAEREDENWHFRCEDNGIGIEPEYAERVFVIFQRLHTKDQYSGTGIGLAMCKKIVEYHGGSIWIDPDRENGTTVHWTLPADLEPETPPVLSPTTKDVPL